MKPTIQIDLAELYEYQDELNNLITRCQKINEESELIREKLMKSDVPVDHLITIFEILEKGV